MTPSVGVIFCFAYITGLLFAAVPWGSYSLLGLGIAIALGRSYGIYSDKRRKLSRITPKIWVIAGIIGCLAAGYFEIRLPHPAANDISQLISNRKTNEQIFTVEGKVSSLPRLTNSNRAQFWLKPDRVNEVNGENNQPTNSSSQVVSGNLYVTVPVLQATGLYPQTAVAITGKLYLPKPALNPGGFDFKSYLQKTGTFAGLRGNQLTLLNYNQTPHWGWWRVARRIVKAQVAGLGSPEGLLVSSIVLGSKAVDLPNNIKDSFIQVGLAHALAASGFQVSLILGFVLAITQKLPVKTQVVLGTCCLFIFVGLTGLQPAVLRAAIMGWAGLVSIAVQRKTKPLGLLLLAATILLLINPLWVWDLGFQLSFLATCGLIITVNPLVRKLDWMPTAIASLVAVPIAAAIWTLPLQLHSFGIVPIYSVVANIIVTPFISLITIVGIFTSLLGVLLPALGSAIASSIYYPTNWLIKIVEFFVWLPGNSFALGKIALWQLLLLYLLICIVSVSKWWQRRWVISTLLALGLVAFPLWQARIDRLRIDVLANSSPAIIIVQEQSKTIAINGENGDNIKYNLLPFLKQRGVNKIDTAIALESKPKYLAAWLQIDRALNLESLYVVNKSGTVSYQEKELKAVLKNRGGSYQALPLRKPIVIGSIAIELLKENPRLVQIQIKGKSWLNLESIDLPTQKNLIPELEPVQVICWSGDALLNGLIERLRPEVAIASSSTIDPDTLKYLQANGVQVFMTGRDGAIQWTPQDGFDTNLEMAEQNSLLL